GLVVALVGGLALANMRTAEATNREARFVRPMQEALAEKPAATDLTRFGVMGDEEALSLLSNNLKACTSALQAAGVSFTMVPAKQQGACGYQDALEVKASLADLTPNRGAPDELPMTCDLAARMHIWERHVVIPAAEKYLGSPVKE